MKALVSMLMMSIRRLHTLWSTFVTDTYNTSQPMLSKKNQSTQHTMNAILAEAHVANVAGD